MRRFISHLLGGYLCAGIFSPQWQTPRLIDSTRVGLLSDAANLHFQQKCAHVDPNPASGCGLIVSVFVLNWLWPGLAVFLKMLFVFSRVAVCMQYAVCVHSLSGPCLFVEKAVNSDNYSKQNAAPTTHNYATDANYCVSY